MTASEILSIIVSTLESTYFTNTTIEEIHEFSTDKFFIKVRTSLNQNIKLQVRVYKNKNHIDYSYQIFDLVPIMRWDNAEHYMEIPSSPHHFHNQDGDVVESPLTGNPEEDLLIVTQIIKNLYNI